MVRVAPGITRWPAVSWADTPGHEPGCRHRSRHARTEPGSDHRAPGGGDHRRRTARDRPFPTLTRPLRLTFAVSLLDWAGQALRVPLVIPVSCGIQRRGGVLVSHRVLGTAAEPFVDFGMSVRKGEPASTIVVGRRNVAPLGGLDVWIIEAITIVDAVRMFVEHHEDHRRILDIGLLEELDVGLEKAISALVSDIGGLVDREQPHE